MRTYKKRPPFVVVDSTKVIEIQEHRIYAIAYEPVWQAFRAGCSFGSLEEARASFSKLEVYVTKVPRDNIEEIQYRFWRATNFLNAIPIDKRLFGSILSIPRSVTEMLREYRDSLYERFEAVGFPVGWDWAISRSACEKMWQDEAGAYFLYRLWLGLNSKRGYKSPKKYEMRYFMNIITETQPNE